MNNIDNLDNLGENSRKSNKDYIDLKLFFLSINRNKKLVFSITLIGFLFGLIYGFVQKKVWMGEFQIVIDSNLSPSAGMSELDPKILQFSGLNQNKRLETEVGILKSPSVLMSVFDFVKTKKISQDNKNNIRFNDWKENNLSINLKEKTSILDITFKDNDKELILPVLNKLSTEYQNYSGKKRLRELELGISYFENQIKTYKEKSKNSLNEAQTFALDNELSTNEYLLDNFSSDNNKVSDKNNLTFADSLDFSSLRVALANQLKTLDRQIKLIKKVEDNSEQIIYIASTIPEIRGDSLFGEAKNIQLELSRLRFTYKEGDNLIKKTVLEKEIRLNLLKKQIQGYLDSERKNLLASLKSIERPRDILIKYNELVRNSRRDLATLNSLESNYSLILLEKARLKDPWQLITKPTLYPYHVAPKKKQLLFFGTFAGLIFGLLSGFINDKRKDIIYSIDELDICKNYPILNSLSLSKDENFDEILRLILKGPLANIQEDIAFLTIGQSEVPYFGKIKNSLENISKQNKNKFTSNLLEAIEFKNIVLIIVFGNTKKKEIKNIFEKLLLLNNNILGCLVINNK